MDIGKKEKLVALFKMDKPYALTYNYRKKGSAYKTDLPFLNELISDGLIKLYEKTNKRITFVYIGE